MGSLLQEGKITWGSFYRGGKKAAHILFLQDRKESIWGGRKRNKGRLSLLKVKKEYRTFLIKKWGEKWDPYTRGPKIVLLGGGRGGGEKKV